MAFFLHTIQGLQNTSFPWSMTMVSEGSESEATIQTTWHAAVVDMWSNTDLKAYIPADTTLTETSTSTASPTFKQTTKTITNVSIAGTSSDPALSYRTCEIITWRSVFATRWGRGRWFFPALATNALAADGYSILDTAQDALSAAVGAFWAGLGSVIQPQILHRKAPLDGAVTAYSTSVIASADIPDAFATQRRRADKRVPTRVSITL